MEKKQNSKFGQGFRYAPILATLLLVISLSSSAKPFDEKEPNFKAVVFKKHNTMIFKAIAKDLSGAKIEVKITNAKGEVIYQEKYSAKKTYNRDFNVGDLGTGTYLFEINNGKESYVQHFEIDSKNEVVIK